jgi:hypothetical protein
MGIMVIGLTMVAGFIMPIRAASIGAVKFMETVITGAVEFVGAAAIIGTIKFIRAATIGAVKFVGVTTIGAVKVVGAATIGAGFTSAMGFTIDSESF